MRILVIVLLFLAAHFSLTAFVPGEVGKAAFYWPFAADSKPILAGLGGLPAQGGGILTPVLAGVAGLCFIGALLSLFGIVVSATAWVPLVVVGSVFSTALFALYLSPLSLIPIAVNVVLLWGVLLQHWTVASLSGV